jgi:hypothetical protein
VENLFGCEENWGKREKNDCFFVVVWRCLFFVLVSVKSRK